MRSEGTLSDVRDDRPSAGHRTELYSSSDTETRQHRLHIDAHYDLSTPDVLLPEQSEASCQRGKQSNTY